MNINAAPDNIAPYSRTRHRGNRSRELAQDYSSRLLLSALFLLLVCYTGSLVGAFSARPHMVAIIATIALCLGCCVSPAEAHHGAPRLIAVFWRKCEKLPATVLLFLAGWLLFDAAAVSKSTVRSLSYEVFGSHLWSILIASLIYGYATRGSQQVSRLISAIIVALDVVIINGVGQYAVYWTNPHRDNSFHAQHYAVSSFLNDPNQLGHYLALLLPLALWDAARAFQHTRAVSRSQSLNLTPAAQSLWRGWRLARAGVIIGLGAAITSRSNWLAVAVGLVFYFALLTRRQKAASGETNAGGIASLLRPYRVALILGLVLSCGVGLQQADWMKQRLQSTVSPSDLGTVGRGAIWRNGFRMAMRRPVLGWGPGTFAVNYPMSLRTDQYREAVLQAHNIYLQRFFEEGAPALLCWLLFVGGIWTRGLAYSLRRTDTEEPPRPRRGELAPEERSGLLTALLAGLLAYGICGFFVMPEQMPTMLVHFYGFLALVMALLSAPGTGEGGVQRTSASSRWLARGIAVAGCGLFALSALPLPGRLKTYNPIPPLWNTLQARAFFDDAMRSTSAGEREYLLREARDLDPAQPVYWSELGHARFETRGRTSARSIVNFYRAAAHRSVYDAVWRHNIGMLSLLAGATDEAIESELHATKYDPTYSFYQATLADAYALSGQTAMADARRARARKYSLPPVAHDPLDPDPQKAQHLYFCSTVTARYRRIVRGCELIVPPGYTIDGALNGTQLSAYQRPPDGSQ